jgi:hypothetical protein
MNAVGVLMSLVFSAIGLGILWYARSVSNTPTYQADVAYRYKVRGRDYSSARITLANFSSTGRRAQGIVDRYPTAHRLPSTTIR